LKFYLFDRNVKESGIIYRRRIIPQSHFGVVQVRKFHFDGINERLRTNLTEPFRLYLYYSTIRVRFKINVPKRADATNRPRPRFKPQIYKTSKSRFFRLS